MSNLALCSSLLELLATYRGVKVICLLDSGATHSFMHPHVVSLTSVAMSKGAKLIVKVANGSQVVCNNAVETGLVFTAQGDKTHKKITTVKLYMKDEQSTDLILEMKFCNGITHR